MLRCSNDVEPTIRASIPACDSAKENEKVSRDRHERVNSKEMERHVVVLTEQISWNGYTPVANDWKRRWIVEQEIKSATRADHAIVVLKEAERSNKVADLELIRAPYLACGITEHCIEWFAAQSVNSGNVMSCHALTSDSYFTFITVPMPIDDITTKKKQRILPPIR